MGEIASKLIQNLYSVSPYSDFTYADFPLDLQGGHEHAMLARFINELRPQNIVEVGDWKGATAIWMASLVREKRMDAAIVCIDTWLGSIEHWLGSFKGWDIRPYLKHGYPTLYYQFLANVMHSNVQDLIVPVPNSSLNAARWLQSHRFIADLIYVDASHEEDDVYQDLSNYWSLLRPGGILCGDDWHAQWYGVICM